MFAALHDDGSTTVVLPVAALVATHWAPLPMDTPNDDDVPLSHGDEQSLHSVCGCQLSAAHGCVLHRCEAAGA